MKVSPLSLSVMSSGEKMELMLFTGDMGIETVGRDIIRNRKDTGNDDITVKRIEREIKNLILLLKLDWPHKLPKPRIVSTNKN